jgi:hypothetical protein
LHNNKFARSHNLACIWVCNISNPFVVFSTREAWFVIHKAILLDSAIFFNWYYFSFTISMMAALTIIVYIQDNVSWSWGFAIPTSLIFLSFISFLLGVKLYIHVKPEGSTLTSFLQVLVGAGRKRHLSLPSQTSDYYNPPQNGVLKSRMALTDQFM